ncbi:MAG TPA: hypothetical protein VKA20_06110 [Rubrobacter sp.]|nr:hypothetical protein [Rubrobacter sp.]
MDEDYTTLLSGVGLFALLSQEQLGRIAYGIPAKSFEVGEHVFTPLTGARYSSCSSKGGCASTAWKPDRKLP